MLYARSPLEQERYANTDRLISAAYNGLLWEVENMIPISDVDGFESKALRVAIENGHTDCARALLPHTSMVWVSRWGVPTAVKSGQEQMVELLIPLSNDTGLKAGVLSALETEQTKVARMLLAHVDVNDISKTLMMRHYSTQSIDLFNVLCAQMQSETIHNHIANPQYSAHKRKI